MRDKLFELIGKVQDCGCDVTDVVKMNYVENSVLVDYLISNGVTISSEVEELRADNDRLCEMWAKATSDASKYQAESVKYKRMLDDAYEMIGKITDRYG